MVVKENSPREAFITFLRYNKLRYGSCSLTDRIGVCGTSDRSSILRGSAKGKVPERLNGQVSKTLEVRKGLREFESRPFRL